MDTVSAGKGRRVTFRMDDADFFALEDRSERAGLTRSQYLRLLVRIPISTEANAEDEHRILFDRKALWAMSRELRRWGYHYNQAVHALNSVNYHVQRGRLECDLLDGKGELIERELCNVNANAARIAGELGRINSEMLAEAD